MIELTDLDKVVLETLKKYDNIGISEINKKTDIPLTQVYTILVKLSILDLIVFKKDGKYGLAGNVNNGNNQ